MKKVVSVLAVTLFMASSLNANVESEKTISCWDHASYIVDTLVEQGHLTYAQGSDLFGAILDGCTD